MVGKAKLSQGEMETVRVLWGLHRATVRDVHAGLASERPIEFGTVQTYLRRLEAKGYVKSTLENRMRIYTTRVKPERVIREAVDDMVGRLFGGHAMPLMRHLVQQSEMSSDDIEELRQLVEQLKKANVDD